MFLRGNLKKNWIIALKGKEKKKSTENEILSREIIFFFRLSLIISYFTNFAYYYFLYLLSKCHVSFALKSF